MAGEDEGKGHGKHERDINEIAVGIRFASKSDHGIRRQSRRAIGRSEEGDRKEAAAKLLREANQMLEKVRELFRQEESALSDDAKSRGRLRTGPGRL